MNKLKEKNSPMISVVIPMYNVAKTIEQCMQSVLNQDFDLFEVICVDDGCSDNTVAIVESFDDPRIRIIRQRNRGLAAARNTGINASHAPFIALLDSDDFWHVEKLNQHFQHLCNNPVIGVSYSSSAFVDDNGIVMGIGQYPKTQDVTAEHILCRNPVGNGSAPVMRRIALEEIAFTQIVDGDSRKAYFNETLRQSEDIELWLRMALNTHWHFEGVAKALTYYRVNASGLSANLSNQLASWEHAIALNNPGNEAFFAQWSSLARAYQKRYLARRAIQSNNTFAALNLFIQAIVSNPKILFQDPARTIATGLCSILSLLPKSLYEKIQSRAIQTIALKRSYQSG